MYDMEKEERVLDNLRIYVKYDKSITREQAEETIDFIMELENKIDELVKNQCKENKRLNNIINELGETNGRLGNAVKDLQDRINKAIDFITSHESIEIMQQTEHSENNKGFDEKTIIEMTRRYIIAHNKLLEILDKEKE